ncbi:amidohydrolase [Anaerosinus massiliensis]|uniref:amidohydrolase n=1 Tax=Massilibacillus massiliensis TaxID=1806837 RepID=UPI000AB971F5|nr:amidohydrolase [Massilibacillus massiliensis]
MILDHQITTLAEDLKDLTIARRRDFHRHPESAWVEFRTSAIIADILSDLGYEVQVGKQVIAESAMSGVPKAIILAEHMKRALNQGANPKWVNKMGGGKTGVVGIFTFKKPGPTIALRFDIDATDITETQEESHIPCKEGFTSIYKGSMHACGHDGHTAIGLAVAEILVQLQDHLAGTIKLIFQPAEEGTRGAKAMVERGVVDDVDFIVGAHLGLQMKRTGQLTCNVTSFLATSKFDAEFSGLPAHAGAAPEEGKNALLAASCATLNLHAIPRHSEGASRINVGILTAGSGRNIIPANAILKLETRGATSKINQYMAKEAKKIITTAALMYDVKVKITDMGSAAGGDTNRRLAEKLTKTATRLGIFKEMIPACPFGASEDFSYFIERIQKTGGQAAYMMIGTTLSAGHHDSRFDFDETALDPAIKLLAAAAAELLTKEL